MYLNTGTDFEIFNFRYLKQYFKILIEFIYISFKKSQIMINSSFIQMRITFWKMLMLMT